MNPRIQEFHCIMPIGNIPSVLEHGILSYERAARLPHRSVAMPEMQDRRDKKKIPGGLKLHQYASLYLDARNPMMFKRKGEANSLCVLRVSTGVTAIQGVVVTDMNAGSDWMRAFPPDRIDCLDLESIYADDWRHPGNPPAYWRHKAKKCAEVLVPHCVPIEYLSGAFVATDEGEHALRRHGFPLPISLNPVMFFCSL